jgi:hypothetical protein
MTTVALSIGGVLVLAMIGISTWGWRALPPDVRIPVHSGIGGYNNFRSKTTGLITWPVGGAVIYGINWGIAGRGGTAVDILPILLAVVVGAQVGAIRVALRPPRSR